MFIYPKFCPITEKQNNCSGHKKVWARLVNEKWIPKGLHLIILPPRKYISEDKSTSMSIMSTM